MGKLAMQYSGFRVFASAKRSKPSSSASRSSTISATSKMLDPRWNSTSLLEDANRQPTVTGRKIALLLEDGIRQPSVPGKKDVPLLEHVLLENLDSSSPSSRGYISMGSMVSSFDRDNVTGVMVVKSKEHSGARILEFGSNSGVVDHERQLSPSSNVVKMHLIATKLKFLPGGLTESFNQVGGDRELALKYGEDLEKPEVCNDLAKEIKRLQDEAAAGSKFVICSALGTSAKQDQLEKQGRPNFAKNRASNMKRRLQVALQAVGAKQTFPDPIVKYRRDRVAALLMKSYIGAEPACNENEIRIPHLRRHSARHAHHSVDHNVDHRAADRASIDVDADVTSHEEVTGSGTILEEIGNLEVTDGKIKFKGLSRTERKTKLRSLKLKYHPDKAPESANSEPIFRFAQEWWDCEFRFSESTKEAWAELHDGVYKVFCE